MTRRRWDPTRMAEEAREQSRKDRKAMVAKKALPVPISNTGGMIVFDHALTAAQISQLRDEWAQAYQALIPAPTPMRNRIVPGVTYQMTGVGPIGNMTWTTTPLTQEPLKPKPLPTRHQPETIRAFKVATIKVRGGGLVFGAAGRSATYGVEAVATCLMGRSWLIPDPDASPLHIAPQADCTCGFYAVSKERLMDELWNDYRSIPAVRLEVELFGRVVKHENGYRAERQRVMGVVVPRVCRACSFLTRSYIGQCGCSACRGMFPRHVADDPIGVQIDQGTLVPACANHAPLGAHSLSQVAERLGTEVRWG